MKSHLSNMRGRITVGLAVIALGLSLGLAIFTSVLPGITRDAQAATQNFPPGTPVYAMPVHISGTYTATATPLKFTLPYAGRLIGFSAAARGVSGTVTVDLQAGGVSLLSSALTLSTGVSEAVIATAAVSDETVITAVLTLSGSTPTVTDVSILPTFVR